MIQQPFALATCILSRPLNVLYSFDNTMTYLVRSRRNPTLPKATKRECSYQWGVFFFLSCTVSGRVSLWCFLLWYTRAASSQIIHAKNGSLKDHTVPPLELKAKKTPELYGSLRKRAERNETPRTKTRSGHRGMPQVFFISPHRQAAPLPRRFRFSFGFSFSPSLAGFLLSHSRNVSIPALSSHSTPIPRQRGRC